jgi:acylglycerol lipase
MKAIHEEGKFKGKGGTNLYYQVWKPEKSKAVITGVHGYAEYSGRYNHVGEHFANEEIAFRMADLRGHGLSEGIRGHVDHFDDYLDDLDIFVASSREKGKKLFLLGHSLGGEIAIAYALKNPNKIDGMVLSSPLLKLALQVPPELEKMVRDLSESKPTQSVPNQIDPYILSHDKKLCEKYAKDPMVFKTTTARWATEFFAKGDELLENAGKLKVPTLLLLAGSDKLVKMEASKEFAKKVTEKDFQLKVYDGFYHELFNEVEKEKVFRDVDAWLKPRI